MGSGSASGSVNSSQNGLGTLPIEFPVFDGGNPKWWKRCCEKQFLLMRTPESDWKDVASLRFFGLALLWLQSTEHKIESLNWGEFCELVCHHFGRDQYQSLIRKMNRVRQTGTVYEYIEQFNILMHQLLAHSPTLDQEIFTTNFIDGLKDEIRVVVVIQ